jgi:hypothetical protein
MDDADGNGVSDCRLLQDCTGQTKAQLLCNSMDPTSCPAGQRCLADAQATININYPYCH